MSASCSRGKEASTDLCLLFHSCSEQSTFTYRLIFKSTPSDFIAFLLHPGHPSDPGNPFTSFYCLFSFVKLLHKYVSCSFPRSLLVNTVQSPFSFASQPEFFEGREERNCWPLLFTSRREGRGHFCLGLTWFAPRAFYRIWGMCGFKLLCIFRFWEAGLLCTAGQSPADIEELQAQNIAFFCSELNFYSDTSRPLDKVLSFVSNANFT